MLKKLFSYDRMSRLLVSLLLLVFTMAPFFMVFEKYINIVKAKKIKLTA